MKDSHEDHMKILKRFEEFYGNFVNSYAEFLENFGIFFLGIFEFAYEQSLGNFEDSYEAY